MDFGYWGLGMSKYQIVFEKWDICETIESNYDHADALEKFCEKYDRDSGDYLFAGDNGVEGAFVRLLPDGEWVELDLEVRAEPVYSAGKSTRQYVKENPQDWKAHYCLTCLKRLDAHSGECKPIEAWGPSKEAVEEAEEKAGE